MGEPQTILVVDDERNIGDLVALYAEQAGFGVLRAFDGVTALDMIRVESPTLVVLDLMLPKMNGWDVCKAVRALATPQADTPVIMLTARGDDVDKIVGLELGADDYLSKPFNPRELISRIKAILRRTNQAVRPSDAATALQVGTLRIEVDKHAVSLGENLIKLRAKEFDLLLFLAENSTRVFTREKLLEHVWGFEFGGETRTVDVHVAQLRKHLLGGDIEIETVFGVGYKLVVR